MATKIEVYNRALLHMGGTRLKSLSENRSSRRNLDAAYDQALKYMLGAGLWNFGSRALELQSSDSVVPEFGYDYAFVMPEDYARTVKISDNEELTPTLSDFEEYGEYLLADVEPLYLLYVSTDEAFGGDPGKWTPTFVEALALELCHRTAGAIAQKKAEEVEAYRKQADRMAKRARGRDAVNQAPSRLPTGRLVNSRRGGRGGINSMRKTGYQY